MGFLSTPHGHRTPEPHGHHVRTAERDAAAVDAPLDAMQEEAAAVGLMLEHVPLDTMQPGDVYTTNDPWMASGHLNDVLLVAPVFDHGTPVALTACTSHLYDLGGLGMGPNGGDVHDEGLFIPPMKLVERGAVNAMLVRIFKANSCSPESNEGDLYALIACCEVGGHRLLEMMGEFGLRDASPQPEEPDARMGHVLICGSRGRVTARGHPAQANAPAHRIVAVDAAAQFPPVSRTHS